MVTGSYVLNAATALPHSHIKGVALYVVGGLFGGLVVGMGHRHRRGAAVPSAAPP